MADWLILQLAPSQAELHRWLLADSHGESQQAERSGSLGDVAAEVTGRRLAVLVPSDDVLVTEVELPAKAGIKAQQAVPYALEEQLAADVETQHFAVGQRDEVTGRTPVVVVTRQLLQGWLTTLSAAGLTPDVLCAATALVPDNPGQVVALLDGPTLYVRRPGQPALALPAQDIGAALRVALGQDMTQEHVVFHATQAQWDQVGASVEGLWDQFANIKVQLLAGGILPALAPALAQGSYINLLCGEFAPPSSLEGGWRPWRLAAALAAALILVHIAGLALDLSRTHRSESQADAAIADIAQRALPGDPGTGNVRQRIEQRLMAGSGGPRTGFLPQLAALAQAVQSVNGARVQAFSFNHNAPVDVKLKTPDAESQDRVVQALRGSGWQADLTSATPNGNSYDGRLQFQGTGSGAGATR